MVLRSGIIIPFQFRDTKKLLMIGVPEENRNLNIWDLKNVVRAAFGIYNFEFRNKKIGFNIPDELLLHYLAQRHDLTNFVIEISQALDDGHAKELLSYEPSCSMAAALKQHHQPHPSHQHPAAHHPHPHPHTHQHQHQLHVPLPQRSNESASHHAHEYVSSSQPNSPAVVLSNESVDNDLLEPQQGNNSGTEPGADGGPKLRLSQNYAERTPESLTQSIDPMDIIPKAEAESEVERLQRASRFLARQEQQQQQQHQAQQQQQQQPQPPQHQQQQQQQLLTGQQIFPSYTHTLPPMNAPNPSQQQSPYTPGLMSRFRMYDDNYVLNRQCRCSDQKMLNDSPTPEEPTNLCQPSSALEVASAAAAPTPLMTLPPCDDEEHDHMVDHDHEHEESLKYRIDKASSGAASAELGMPAYEACSPKMDYDTQDELPDSPHSQPLPPPPLPLTAALPLPPPPTSHHHQHLHQQQQEEQQQLLQERIQHEYMIQQQQQHQHLQQQQHLALLHQQEQEQQHQQQQQQHQQQHHHPQQQGVNMAMGTTTTNNIRQRKERMSKRQKELYVHFLQQHQFINDHRRNDPVLDPYWLKLANLLNAVPQGAVKHVTEWKQTFDNWRYRIFLYARYNSKLQDEEAQNPRNFKPLTRTDKQAYIMWIRNPDTAPPDLDKMRNVFCNLEETAAAAAAAAAQQD